MIQANTEQWMDSAKGMANTAVDKAENAAQRASETADQQNTDQNAGFLQQVIYINNQDYSGPILL